MAGLIVGSLPQLLLLLASLAMDTSEQGAMSVTVGSAIFVAAASLVLYGWEAFAAWLFSIRPASRTLWQSTLAGKLALWGFRRPTVAFFWTIPLGLFAVYGASVIHDMFVHPQQQDILTEFPQSAAGLALFVLVAVVMAPLFEEIVFRGFLFRGFANSWGWKWGALASGAIFGLAHLQLDIFFPLAVLGVALAWVYEHTGSLWTSIALHATFNAIAVAAWALTG